MLPCIHEGSKPSSRSFGSSIDEATSALRPVPQFNTVRAVVVHTSQVEALIASICPNGFVECLLSSFVITKQLIGPTVTRLAVVNENLAKQYGSRMMFAERGDVGDHLP